ncbi:MAG: Coenzyme F420 hydrogenase/dehydrogenase, beta subunit C-terminal domain [Promethearchaeota archaeon]
MSKKVFKCESFNELTHRIIEPGLCTQCGACEAACPVHAIAQEDDAPYMLHDCSEDMDTCSICYEICPHTGMLLSEVLESVAPAPHKSDELGYYQEVFLARATDPGFRTSGSRGGVVNALLHFAMSENLIDCTIISEAVDENPLEIRPAISLVPDDTLSAVDAKFVPSAVAKAFGRAVFEHGKSQIAFVGVPCQVLALRKLEAWKHKLSACIGIIIGLFCLCIYSLKTLTDYLYREYEISSSEIQSIDLEVSHYIITTNRSEIKVPIKEIEDHIVTACKTCTDFTAELADLSIGGAAVRKGWSILIIRTEKGKELVNKAVSKGVLELEKIENTPKAWNHLIQVATTKKQEALKIQKQMEKKGTPLLSKESLNNR